MRGAFFFAGLNSAGLLPVDAQMFLLLLHGFELPRAAARSHGVRAECTVQEVSTPTNFMPNL
jgi:hypothetical protein